MRCQLSPQAAPAEKQTVSAEMVREKKHHRGSKHLPSVRLVGQESKEKLQPSGAEGGGGGAKLKPGVPPLK